MYRARVCVHGGCVFSRVIIIIISIVIIIIIVYSAVDVYSTVNGNRSKFYHSHEYNLSVPALSYEWSPRCLQTAVSHASINLSECSTKRVNIIDLITLHPKLYRFKSNIAMININAISLFNYSYLKYFCEKTENIPFGSNDVIFNYSSQVSVC